jgi:AcrR family transcriptional regulator
MKQAARSQATRDRILDAARRKFGKQGYERTTIRAVAATAEIHPSMVMRYYGSKEGLFAATAEFDLEIPDLTQVRRSEIGKTLVRHFLRRWTARCEELPALLRVSLTHDQARERLLALFRDQVVPAIARVADAADAEACAALVVTQMFGLALTRQVLRLPAVASLPDSLLIERVGATIQNYVTGAISAKAASGRG